MHCWFCAGKCLSKPFEDGDRDKETESCTEYGYCPLLVLAWGSFEILSYFPSIDNRY